MVLKRSLDNSNNESPKRHQVNSKEFLQSSENRQPELVIDLTEDEDQVIELDGRLDLTIYACKKKPELIIDLTEDEDKTFDCMVQACKNGELGKLDANLKNVSNDTLLHHASANGQLEIVTQLLKNRPLSYFTNKSHFTPLHLAALNGHTQVVKELLKYEMDINLKTKQGKNALEFAARNGHLSTVEELLKSGAKTYIVEDDCYEFPLFENLPSKKFSENEIDIMVEILKTHPYPIHQAILHLQIPEITLIVRRLLKSGISPDLQDDYADTVLHIAVMENVHNIYMNQVVAELLKQGVNMDIKNIYRKTPLHLAFDYQNKELEKVEIVKKLLKHGANPNVNGYNGDTPLHKACLNGNILITKILLEYGANVNLLNDHKVAPLHLIFVGGENKIGDVELVIKELLKHGANVNLKKDYGETILHDAASEDDIPEYLFQEFLKHGADLDVKDLNGATPLHHAVEFKQQTNVKSLLKCGADVDIRDHNGYSSFETALTCEEKGIFRMLIFDHQFQ